VGRASAIVLLFFASGCLFGEGEDGLTWVGTAAPTVDDRCFSYEMGDPALPAATHRFTFAGTELAAHLNPNVPVSAAESALQIIGDVNRLVDGTLRVPTGLKVLFCESGAPLYDLTTGFLLTSLFVEVDGERGLPGTERASVGHEYGHAVFDQTASALSPRYVQFRQAYVAATATRFLLGQEVDRLEEQGIDDLPPDLDARSSTNRLEFQRIAAQPHFQLLTSYGELFADTVAVFVSGDGQINSRGQQIGAYKNENPFRDFTIEHNPATIPVTGNFHYSISAPARSFLWRAYRARPQRAAEMLSILLRESIADAEALPINAAGQTVSHPTSLAFTQSLLGRLRQHEAFAGL
jgi:hypothetical protein